MSDVGFGDARVIIKIEVDDSEANRKLTALAQRMRDLDGRNRSTKRSFDDTGKALDRTAKSAGRLAKSAKDVDDKFNWFGRRLNQLGKDFRGTMTAMKAFGAGMSGLLKIVKYGAIEFGVMTLALGAMALTLKVGQVLAKAWSASVKAMAGAAGVAVAGIATVLGALRELQVAQMKPLYTGPLSLGLDMSMLLGNKRLAMYGESLQAIAAEQMRATGRIDAQFQQRLVRMADFAMGDPKALQSISAAFGEMQKQGKVTADVYSQLQSASPALAKAFEELAGGEKQAAAAAAAGSISFEQFNKAMMEGKLKALQPFNGALDAINDTLIGRLKGTLVSIKEDLTQLGLGFVDTFKGPLAKAERDIETFILRITPTLRRVFPELVGNVAGDAEGLLGGALTKLATSINTNMPKLVGAGKDMAESWGRFRNSLREIGDYLERMKGPWDTLYNTILRPLGQELMGTISFAFQQFTGMVGRNGEALRDMGQSLHGIFEGIRALIKVFVTLKEVLQPILQGFMRFASLIGNALNMDNLLGGFLRFVALGGVLLLLFKKFIVSLGQMKLNTVTTMQALKNFLFGKKEEAAATTAATAATDRQSAAYTRMAASIDLVVVALQRMLALHTAAAARMGVPNAFGIAATGNPWGLQMPPRGSLPGMQQQSGTTWSTQYKGVMPGVTMYPGLSPVPLGPTMAGVGKNPFMQQGAEQAKGFKAGVAKYGVGAALAGGMVATIAGSAISGRASKTSNGWQAAGGALSGAGTGAMMGAMFGPWGAAIGAGAGALIGGISGWLGADKERERQRTESINAINNRVDAAAGTLNRQSDFNAAFAEIEARRDDLRRMQGPLQDQIKAAEAESKTAVNTTWNRFGQDLLKKAIADGKVAADSVLYVNKDHFYGQNADGGLQYIGDTEANYVENYAKEWAMANLGASQQTVDTMADGKGGGQNASLIKTLVSQKFEQNIGDLKEELTALEDEFGNTAAASEALTMKTKELEAKQKVFNTNMDNARDMTGLAADDISAYFDEMGLSMSEAGVGINQLNDLLGYTGDAAADLATSAGRLRDSLLAGTDAIKQRAESEERLRGQLTALYETRGNPISQNDADIVTADTMTALVDTWAGKLASGEKTFAELFGTMQTVRELPNGTQVMGRVGGDAFAQLEAMRSEAIRLGLPPEVLASIDQQVALLTGRLETAMVDPFERLKIDSAFGSAFTSVIEVAKGNAITAMTEGGKDPTSALKDASNEVITFLKQNGFTITPETEAQVTSLLGNTILNSSDAMLKALQDGGTYAAAQIRAAITNSPPPRMYGPPAPAAPVAPVSREVGTMKDDTGSPRAGRFGDTSSRFRKTMGAHAMFNSRFGGRRSVTSGVRDFALGSLNSDHTTGAAFDLVGDNLLGYGKDVRDSGGFAEMHGGPDNRHLHVVPNVGDSYSPRPAGARNAMAMAAPAAGGAVTINVYGAEGQSVQALADEVMDRIERKQRSDRERY